MRITLLLCALTALSLPACGGDGDTTGAGGSTAASTSAATTGSASGSGGDTSGSTGAGGAPIDCGVTKGADQVVINEINAIGTSEWVELVNPSATPADLCGYAMADSLKVGGPDLTNAIRFPPGSTIPAGGYLIVLGDQTAEPTPTPHKDCLPNAPPGSVCFYANWKISAANGEFMYFLSANDEMVTSAEYPMNAIDPLSGAGTWSRLPDKTGDFAASKTPTPGAENKP